MLTPQEVSARSFTKTMMGGYNMTMVDEFLDELTDDYTSLYKENASLKAKMKVLVEKVEEYRATEDSMRATLLTAQRMADSIVKEAEEKRDGILKQAEAAAREKLDGYRKEAEQYQKRLQQGQEEIRRFVAESRALCEKELLFLEEFPSRPLEEEAETAGTAETIGEQILSAGEPAPPPAVPEPAPQSPVEPQVPQTPETPQAPVAQSVSTTEKLLDSLAATETEDLSATRRVNINELKFGPNYRSDAD
ncbi:MAG: DivIVA domain-containing protein [Oscillibacter sp.]|nr:DivIVA domain-containing protein [Oscillibacter sp.]